MGKDAKLNRTRKTCENEPREVDESLASVGFRKDGHAQSPVPMPDTIPETEGADEGHTSDWTNGDFIEVADLRRSFGYLAATEKATLTLTNVMLSKSEANVKDIEIELLRTEEQCSAKTQQGRGLVIAMPPGVERPPFLRVRCTDAQHFTVHEGDLRLPKADSGKVGAMQLMAGETPATIAFDYEIAEHERKEDEVRLAQMQYLSPFIKPYPSDAFAPLRALHRWTGSSCGAACQRTGSPTDASTRTSATSGSTSSGRFSIRPPTSR